MARALIVMLMCLPACGTGPDVSKPAPSYSWRLQVNEAGTGEPVEHPVFRVSEAGDHLARGWAPFLGVQEPSPGIFLLEYSINGISCDPPRDTVLTLTLEVGDSLGLHESVERRSSWRFECSSVPTEPVTPLPFPSEDDVLVELPPVQPTEP